MKKLSLYFSLSLATLFVIVGSLLFTAKPAQAASDVVCSFRNSGTLECRRPNAGGSALESLTDVYGEVAGLAGGVGGNLLDISGKIDDAFDVLTCGGVGSTAVCARDSEAFFYEPNFSANANYPIFCRDQTFKVSGDDTRCIHFVGNNPVQGVAAFRTDPISASSVDQDRLVLVGGVENVDNNPGGNACGITRPTDCRVVGGALTTERDYDGSALNTDAFLAAAAAEVSGDDCGLDSPLSFVLCPIQQFITEALTTVIDTLNDFLKNPDLSGNSQIQTALRSIINLANSFYTIIFLLIILANFISIPGLDNYNIKKLLPKFVAAVILTQFTPLICSLVLDLGNVLGVILPTYILGIFGIPGTPGDAFANAINPYVRDTTAGVGASLGEFMLFGITVIAGLIIGLIALFYLVARYLFLIGLVLASPLAFAAWVLPKTENFFKQWWTYLIKLSLMFLLVNLLFAGGVIFQRLLTGGVLGGGSVGGFFADLLSAFVPLMVLLLVPKTLKASTAVMGAVTGALSKATDGGVAGKAKSASKNAVKKSGEEGKLAELKSKGFGAASKAVGGSNSRFGRGFEKKQRGIDDKVSSARKADFELRKTKDLANIAAQRGSDNKPTKDAELATKVLNQKFQDKLVRAKQVHDAGGTLSADDQKSFNDLSDAIPNNPGRTYHESVMQWETKNQAELNPGGAPADHEQAALSALSSKGVDESNPRGRYYKDGNNPGTHYTPPAPAGTPGGGGPGAGGTPPNPGPPPPPPAGGTRSDIRLKEEVTYLHTLPGDIRLYRFKYIWTDVEYVGVIAQEILEICPQAVTTDTLGFYRVDYQALGIQMVLYSEWVNNKRIIYIGF